jgi:hypothetical protein
MSADRLSFQSHLNTQLGCLTFIKDGDEIEVIRRPDLLWDVILNGIKAQYCITADFVNQLAGQKLVGDSA